VKSTLRIWKVVNHPLVRPAADLAFRACQKLLTYRTEKHLQMQRRWEEKRKRKLRRSNLRP